MYIDPEQRQGPLELHDVEQQNVVRRLRSLPQEIRQPYDWTEFQRRALERTNVGAHASAMFKRHAALAAALILVVVGVAIWARVTRPVTPLAVESHVPSGSELPTTAGLAAVNTVHGSEVRANDAERWLASLPREPVVVRVGTRAAVTGLEDRIAQLDDVLSVARVEGVQPARVAALEQQRVHLVTSLVQVRYAETLVSASR